LANAPNCAYLACTPLPSTHQECRTLKPRSEGGGVAEAGAPRRTALVTGAGGLGVELTRLLAADGCDLVLVGRDAARWERAGEEGRARPRAAARCAARDLAEPGAAPDLGRDLGAPAERVDIPVNNAGVGLYGRLDERGLGELDRMVQLNVGAL